MRNAFEQSGRGRVVDTTNVDKRSILMRLTRYVLSNYKVSCLVVTVCIMVTSVTTLLSTLFTRTLIDDYVVPLTQSAAPDYAPLARALLTLGGVLLVGVLCSYANSRLMINVAQGTMLRLRRDMFSHMEQLPVRFFDSHSHGDVMSVYTNDVDSLRQMIGGSLPGVFSSIITIVVTLVSMLALSVPLTMVSLLVSGLMIFATKRLSRKSRACFRAQQDNLARVNGFIEEMMTGQRVVKVFCHEEEAVSEFETINEQLRQSACNANKTANIVMPVNANLGNLAYVLIAVVGGVIALSDKSGQGLWPLCLQLTGTSWLVHNLTLGTIVSFLTLNKNFSQPVSHISQQLNSIMNASAGAERVFALVDEEDENGDENNAQMVPAQDQAEKKAEGNVVLRHVDFGYDASRQVLFDINVEAKKGQKIAFVGGTGAGKTTITNLINRFYDIERGEITLDGTPVTAMSKQQLRRSLGMVLQETHLFSETVLENIRYGRLDATDEECVEAAKRVGADAFIRRLPNGYLTNLSGGGNNLSQGERQLLAIARTAVANPAVLILDEATSSIDTRTERMVQHGMDQLMEGRTTFVIAHRLSTVRNADHIIVLERGHIIEQGTHDELVAQRGKYYQLVMGI